MYEIALNVEQNQVLAEGFFHSICNFVVELNSSTKISGLEEGKKRRRRRLCKINGFLDCN